VLAFLFPTTIKQAMSAMARNVISRELVAAKVSGSPRVVTTSWWLDRLLQSAPMSMRSRYLAGSLFIWNGDLQHAESVLQAGDGADADPLAGWALSEVFIQQGKIETAARALRLAHIPTDRLARWGDENWSLLEQGGNDDTRADLYFGVALAQGGGSWQARRSIGRWLLFRHKDAQAALLYLEPVHAEWPENAYVASLLAQAYHLAGDINRAVELMELADALSADKLAYRPGLALFYLERNDPGDLQRARQALEPYLQQYPNHDFAKRLMAQIEHQER